MGASGSARRAGLRAVVRRGSRLRRGAGGKPRAGSTWRSPSPTRWADRCPRRSSSWTTQTLERHTSSRPRRAGCTCWPRPSATPRRTSTYGVGEMVLAAVEHGRRTARRRPRRQRHERCRRRPARRARGRLARARWPAAGWRSARSRRRDLLGSTPPLDRFRGVELVVRHGRRHAPARPAGRERHLRPRRRAPPPSRSRLSKPRSATSPTSCAAPRPRSATCSPGSRSALDRQPGAGAAGGLGYGLMLLGGPPSERGRRRSCRAVRFPALLADADLVVTGEGRFDWQSLRGKVVTGVAQATAAARHTRRRHRRTGGRRAPRGHGRRGQRRVCRRREARAGARCAGRPGGPPRRPRGTRGADVVPEPAERSILVGNNRRDRRVVPERPPPPIDRGFPSHERPGPDHHRRPTASCSPTSPRGKVKSLLEQEGRDDLRLRVGVQPGGCSGLIYQLYFDERTLDGDVVRDFDGVEVVVDRMSVALPRRRDDRLRRHHREAGLHHRQPERAGSSCACGDSFS